ncbi:hypothetical protein BDV95DRAFT_54928 [Massariosphaeria phaeospora]|uniref:Uncharacterized protein n=1 Tax=Massariosphaeria phaeospora TaxID=100035 RepID=A0A7C8IA31_9PLEO|nr:hypothetical protein BDV95DRAFT_54928 [Massariosphaeria phaeospora]
MDPTIPRGVASSGNPHDAFRNVSEGYGPRRDQLARRGGVDYGEYGHNMPTHPATYGDPSVRTNRRGAVDYGRPVNGSGDHSLLHRRDTSTALRIFGARRGAVDYASSPHYELFQDRPATGPSRPNRVPAYDDTRRSGRDVPRTTFTHDPFASPSPNPHQHQHQDVRRSSHRVHQSRGAADTSGSHTSGLDGPQEEVSPFSSGRQRTDSVNGRGPPPPFGRP